MRILVDMDETICDLLTPWLEIYNNIYDDNLTIDEITTYDLRDHVKEEAKEYIHGFLDRFRLFKDLEIYPGVAEYLEKLNKEHEIYIVTYAPSFFAVVDKMNWIAEHLPFLREDQVIFTNKKHLIKADVIIDDNPEYLNNFIGFKIVMERPYNKDKVIPPAVYIPHNDWEYVYKIIKSLDYLEQEVRNWTDVLPGIAIL